MGLVGRLVARMNGEVAAHALESYRRAGIHVLDLSDQLDHLLVEASLTAREPPNSLRIAQLCGWNANALQTVADHLLAADYQHEPRTVGFVPPTLAAEALAFYGQVAGWLSRAQQAIHNEHYELDVTVPAPLPKWVATTIELPPTTYLAGLRDALDRLEARADALAVVETGGRAAGVVRQVRAEARAASEYGRALAAGAESEAEAQTKLAIERLYLYGQLVAMPDLALAPLPRPSTGGVRPGAPVRLPRPGEPGFDKWCLTDPRAVDELRRDRSANRDLDQLWESDPDPARTLALKADIDAALVRHRVAYGIGHFAACPWSAIYVVKRPLRIGRETMHPVTEFTLDVGFDRGRFVRRVVTGPFHPAD